MKGWLLSLAVALALTCASDVAAQTTAPGSTNAARPDVSASLGWLNGNKSDLSSHNNWYNRALHGAVTFGWHWSTHLKTELETSASTEAEFYANREEIINGLRANVAAEYAFSTRRLTLAQQYQFGDNAWFHPHLAAGLDVNWEKIRQVDRDVYFYDARQTTIIRRSTVHPTRTRTWSTSYTKPWWAPTP